MCQVSEFREACQINQNKVLKTKEMCSGKFGKYMSPGRQGAALCCMDAVVQQQIHIWKEDKRVNTLYTVLHRVLNLRFIRFGWGYKLFLFFVCGGTWLGSRVVSEFFFFISAATFPSP